MDLSRSASESELRWSEACELFAEREARRRPRSADDQPLQPGDPEKHHEIPQFWLKGFAEDVEAGLMLASVDRFGSADQVPVSQAAMTRSFYMTTNDAGAPTVGLERSLGRFESDAAPAFKSLRSGTPHASSLERLDICRLLAVQDLRTRPQVRSSQKAMGGVAGRMAVLAQHHGHLPPTDEPTQFIGSKEAALTSLLDDGIIRVCSKLMFLRQWSLLRAAAPAMGFVLPDHPIVTVSANSSGIYGPGGIGSADHLWVPLGPRTMLVMTRPDLANGAHEEMSAHEIEDINRVLIGRASEKVYCAPSDAAAVSGLAADPGG
ncbi:MAG: DUF4238 domain-containing protein [Acidimicrobiaceae bacterium]|nr:DUF4238 domain-containing protein [Acidimicrobiaceae bacterium]MCY3608348.1 DUF4238 domain-containing protein [Acidimicrobiaceae bacterium]